jgi:large repetitive protein
MKKRMISHAARIGLMIVLVVSLATCEFLTDLFTDEPVEEETIEYALSVSTEGNGEVAVAPDLAVYPQGEEVTISASPDDGWVFDRWQGDLVGSDSPATLVMDSDTSIIAVFVEAIPDAITLTVTAADGGDVRVTPERESYAVGTQIELLAIAYDDWYFDHWEGDLSGNANPITFTLDGDKRVTPVYERWVQWTFVVNDGISSSPALGVDGTIYVGSGTYDKGLYAIGSDGVGKWRFQTDGALYAGPAIGEDDTIYIGSWDKNLYAILPDGTETWRLATGGSIGCTPALGEDGTIYIGTNIEHDVYHVIAVNPDGTLAWSFDAGDSAGTGLAIGTDGTIYAGSGEGFLYAIDPLGGKIWSFPEDGTALVCTNPALGEDETLYVGTNDGRLVAIGPDGTELWSYALDGPPVRDPVIGTDGTIFIEGGSGYAPDTIYAINPDGTEKWSITGTNFGAPFIIGADGIIYHRSGYYKISAMSPDGVTLWSASIGENSMTNLVMAPDGTIYVGCGDNRLYAVKTTSPGPADSSWPMFHRDPRHTARKTSESDLPVLTTHVEGMGRIERNPYQTSYETGASVELEAIADPGWEFENWSGAISGTANPATVNVDADMTVNAVFSYRLLWFTEPDSANSLCSPAVGSDGTIYITTQTLFDSGLYAYNPDGSLKWSFPAIKYAADGAAIGSDGTIYFGSQDDEYDGYLYAVNPDSTEQWRLNVTGRVTDTPAIGSDGTIYIRSEQSSLYAVNPDGTQRWAASVAGNGGSSPAIAVDGTIYVGAGSNNLLALNPDGTEKWSFATSNYVTSAPAIAADGTVYFGSDDMNLYAVNPVDGTEYWSYATTGRVRSCPTIASDGTIYVGSGDGNLYAINPDGTEKWIFATEGGIDHSAVIGVDGVIYVGSGDGNLYSINPDGTLRWYFADAIGVASSPMIVSDGTLYFTYGYLYAIRSDSLGIADSPWPAFHQNAQRTSRRE